MLVVLSGGGTAGHINPALALAEELVARGCEVRFAGTPGGVEARLVPQAGIAFEPFEAAGFNRSHPLSLVSALRKIARSTSRAKQWFNDIKPDVVVGFGGYVCSPVVRAAQKMNIPTVLHEQNSVMGLANKMLAKHADMLCLTYSCAAEGVSLGSRVRVELTGNPVRSKIVSATREEGRAMLGVPDDVFVLLVFGGSLGARHINEGIAAMKGELLARPHVHVVHITGPKELDRTCEALALSPDEEKRWHVMGYQDRMGECLAAVDAIVSRSGASSLAEISARAIPALLIPFPHATADHQTTNARAYVDAGCASLIADDQVGTDEFRRLVLELVDDELLRENMHKAAQAQKSAHAASKLADIVMQVAAKAQSSLQ